MSGFTMNGIKYESDEQTIRVLMSVMGPAKQSGDFTAVSAVMLMGLRSGRIIEVK